jgi:hypothetical protein
MLSPTDLPNEIAALEALLLAQTRLWKVCVNN